MAILKSCIISFLLLSIASHLKANDTLDVKSNDSLTLAQAYVNLTLTENFFDTLRVERLSKILPFEESELNVIKNSGFIQTNAYLYNFSYALLYFNKAKLLFTTNARPDRKALLKWKDTLATAITYFNLANLDDYYFGQSNTYNEFIGFSDTSGLHLKNDILELKAKFNTSFNRDIYPDFQRIFYEAKNTGHFNFDSLKYFTTLFNLPLSRNIVDNSGDGKTVNQSQDGELSDINTGYSLELGLDLISRFLQLNQLADDNSKTNSAIDNTCTLYVQYRYFIKDLNTNDSTGFSNISIRDKMKKDAFFLNELSPGVCHVLYNNLEKKYLSGLITAIQAYYNLSLIEKNLDSLSTRQIEKILLFEENELSSINDTAHIRHYIYLYHQAFSLLYYGQAKLLFVNNANPGRVVLLQGKNTLEKAIDQFNLSELDSIFPPGGDRKLFFDLIGFSDSACTALQRGIISLKATFNPYFNRDIYPDFKRIFYSEKKSGQFSFDSLKYYTLMYNLPLSRDILDSGYHSGRTENVPDYIDTWTINNQYKLDLALDLISRYLQLRYIVKTNISPAEKCEYNWTCYRVFMRDLSPADTVNFGKVYDFNQISKDDFFRKELDAATCDKLREQLMKKCGLSPNLVTVDSDSDGVIDSFDKIPGELGGGYGRYYFPIPAPFPSAYLYVKNYKPALTTMKQVDNYFKSIFNKKGYAGHLHYYYVQSGFALTTSLEKINKDGSPVSGSKRWSVSIGGNGSFSLYETFKSIFFATESNFRIFALVISPDAATVQRSAASIGAMQDLLTYSYPSLPKDLQDFSLPQKTLTILVYNYHQDDVGKVPMLDVSKRLTVKDHLEKSGLIQLLYR